MQERRSARRKAIIRRRIFLAVSASALIVFLALIGFIISAIFSSDTEEKGKSDISSAPITSDVSSQESSSEATESKPENQTVQLGEYTLDADFECLLLVNGDNPLPDSYDTEVRKDLVEIDAQYRNNNYVTQIHKDVYPYRTAMVANAQKDGVNLKVWSPFRSYAIQKDLFDKQVARVGGDEEKAATVVARPGTSEHNTGLCADFNMASDAFEKTPMYSWMAENAEDYGFVMRYSAEKQSLTGVIHESWHWRFVGINHAKKMNELNMCLEEYVEYIKNAESIKDN